MGQSWPGLMKRVCNIYIGLFAVVVQISSREGGFPVCFQWFLGC